MRQDVLTGEWISIASARQNRVFLPPADQDPLAPATPNNPSEVPSNYDVAVCGRGSRTRASTARSGPRVESASSK